MAAVVNAERVDLRAAIPNGGPIRIVQAGIPLLDAVGVGRDDRVRDGDIVELDGRRRCWRDGVKIVGRGDARGRRDRGARWRKRGRTSASSSSGFAQNTLEYVEKEAELTFEPLELPPI